VSDCSADVTVKLPDWTVTWMVVLAVFIPESAPTTVTVYVPGVADVAAEIVMELGEPSIVADPGCGAVTAIAEVGFPNISMAVAARDTLPVSLLASMAATVAGALLPGCSVMLPGFGDKVNPAVRNRLIVAVAALPALSVPVTVMA